jgi:hypothetical protein
MRFNCQRHFRLFRRYLKLLSTSSVWTFGAVSQQYFRRDIPKTEIGTHHGISLRIHDAIIAEFEPTRIVVVNPHNSPLILLPKSVVETPQPILPREL